MSLLPMKNKSDTNETFNAVAPVLATRPVLLRLESQQNLAVYMQCWY